MSRATAPLFVAVNGGCNLTCWYCTVHGENRTTGRKLSSGRLAQILERSYARGFRTFRFTGGEPTLRPDLPEVLARTQAMGDDVRIAITTNGSRLDRIADVIPRLKDPRIFVSVDGIDLQLPRHSEPRTGFRIEKWLSPELAEKIQSISDHADVRFNFVLSKSTLEQFPLILEYAIEHEIDLKIFELLLRDFYYAGDRPKLEVFREQYVSVRQLLPGLEARFGRARAFKGTGGRGIPMRSFRAAQSQIVYFDSSIGSHYGNTCAGCASFPCQEGLYALILDANGTLHPAGCTNINLYRQLATASRDKIDTAFVDLQGEIDAADLLPVVPTAISGGELVA